MPSAASIPSQAAPVSIVVPVWRETPALVARLREWAAWAEVREVIVAAADASAGAPAEADRVRWTTVPEPNRGRQMNAGAALATGEWLLFQHADTELTRAHVAALTALGPTDAVGGAFYRRFDERHPRLRWAEGVERWHNRTFGALYGDQSLFARRAHFAALGGFADLPLMEDVEFSRRLRRSGPIALLDPPVASSPRKHLARGSWRTTAENAGLILLYKLGVPPARLHAWYYHARASR